MRYKYRIYFVVFPKASERSKRKASLNLVKYNASLYNKYSGELTNLNPCNPLGNDQQRSEEGALSDPSPRHCFDQNGTNGR